MCGVYFNSNKIEIIVFKIICICVNYLKTFVDIIKGYNL